MTRKLSVIVNNCDSCPARVDLDYCGLIRCGLLKKVINTSNIKHGNGWVSCEFPPECPLKVEKRKGKDE